MLKQVLRFLLVLLAAVIVSGSIYQLVASATGVAPVMENQSGLHESMNRPDRPFGEGAGYRNGGGESTQRMNFTGILLNLAKVTAVSMVIVFISKILNWVSKKRTSKVISP